MIYRGIDNLRFFLTLSVLFFLFYKLFASLHKVGSDLTRWLPHVSLVTHFSIGSVSPVIHGAANVLI